MHLILYAKDRPEDRFQRDITDRFASILRRAAREPVHCLLQAGRIEAAARTQVSLHYEWLDGAEDADLRMLDRIAVCATNADGETLATQHFKAVGLIRETARGCINSMLAHDQVKSGESVAYFIAGPPDEEPPPPGVLRAPPCIDVSLHPELAASLQQALDSDRCDGCAKPACDGRTVAVTERAAASIVEWHRETSADGVEVGGCLLGFVLQNAPGGLSTLVVDHIPAPDEFATVVKHEIRADVWAQILDTLAARQAAGEPDLVIAGSWHSHDLAAIRQVVVAAGAAPGVSGADAENEATILAPSSDDLLLWEVSFGFPHMANAILSAATGRLSWYRWRQAAAEPCVPVTVAEIPACFGAPVVEVT